MYSSASGPWNYHTKWNKSEREKQIWYITYTQNLKKNDANELIYKTETGFPGSLVVKNLPANSGDEEMWVWLLGWENSLE